MQIQNKTSLPGLKEKRYQQKKDIIGYLCKVRKSSKPEICRFTNMTTPTISRIMDELIGEGWVADLGQGASIGGKRPHIFSLNPDAAYILGIDIGREQVKIAIFNLCEEIIGTVHAYPSVLERQDNAATLSDLKDQIGQTLQSLQIPAAKIKAAGISLPGLTDGEGNAFTYLTFEGSNIRKELEKMLGIPVFTGNDASIIALGEHASGTAQGFRNVLCITISECIGMGMILNAQPYTGCNGMAGEFGHIRVSGPGLPCYCGKNGCLETVASGRAILKKARQAVAEGKTTSFARQAPATISLTTIIRAARRHDPFAIELLREAGEKTGEGISTLIHLFNPELVVIGGDITAAGEFILAPIRQAIEKFAFTRMNHQCEIRMSLLHEQACILGTLTLVMRHLYDDDNSSFSLY